MHDVQPLPEGSSSGDPTSSEPQPVGALRLRGGPRRTRQRVVWGEDVVDNEGAGKKSSKSTHDVPSFFEIRPDLTCLVCCIYHKPKRFDESSDEDSSDSESDSDCGHEHHARRPGNSRDGAQWSRGGDDSVVHTLDHDEPNAYEVGPGSKKGKKKAT